MNNSGITKRILIPINNGKIHAGSILSVAKYFYAVNESCLIRDLANEFRNKPELLAVAIVNSKNKALGIIRSEILFATLGKPFGLDILGKCPVIELLENCPRFPCTAELFSVAQELLTPNNKNNGWYILEDDDQFIGIFTARDLSNHLSGITQQDVDLAGKLQSRLIAEHEHKQGLGWNFDAWSRSAKGIGGDFYYRKELANNKHFFCISDVSGKGVSASVLVSPAWGMIRMHDHVKGMKYLLQELNSAIIEAFHMEKYLTGFFLTLDMNTLKLETADMGHSHIFILRNNKISKIKSAKTNLPIGLEQDLHIETSTWQLIKGDILFIYTDGLIEQENEHAEEFGEQRLRSLFLDCIRKNNLLQNNIPIAFDSFRDSIPQQDDVSFISLKIE